MAREGQERAETREAERDGEARQKTDKRLIEGGRSEGREAGMRGVGESDGGGGRSGRMGGGSDDGKPRDGV